MLCYPLIHMGVSQAVADAKKEWGRQALSEADAEDRLAFACERAPTQDPLTSKLREAFQVGACKACQS